MTPKRLITDETTPVWQESIGDVPHKVTVFEHATRNRTLYLRWREAGNWAYESLRSDLYDDAGRRLTGRALDQRKRQAKERRDEKYARIRAGLTDTEKPAAPLTLGETWARIADPDRGLYPTDSAYRREVKRQLGHAARILGADMPWNAIDADALTTLQRRRVREIANKGNRGLRGAEVCMQRILTVAAWLRERKIIALHAAVAPSRWKKTLAKEWRGLTDSAREYEPERPRHTLDDMRAILRVAPDVDPRFALLVALGAELRLGQVARGRRSHLNLERGAFTVYGRGHKKGEVVLLTAGQLRAVAAALDPETGYLRDLERSAPDYPLFPSGQMPGGRKGEGLATLERHADAPSVDRTAIRQWFLEAERRAGIPHMKGRGSYGVRRVAVDGSKAAGISREGLQKIGGWSDSQMPDQIYADQEADYAREEARRIRAQIRDEAEPK